MLTARLIARKKQSADLLFSCRNDERLSSGLTMIREAFASHDVNLAAHAAPNLANTPTALDMRYVLNHYEYISIGIQAGIYDEAMLKDAMRRTVLGVFKCAKGYIDAMRTQHGCKTLYQELQWLAVRWEEKEIAVKFPRGV